MTLSPEALAALRQDYAQRGLREDELAADPVIQFQQWLEEAHGTGLIEPNGMALSTVDAEGRPWSRIVLLKACDARGFVFFTNYGGAKGQHLAHNPHAALTFWWGALERQVNITGRVQRTSREESEHYFASRPLASRLGAWASPQSTVIPGREVLEAGYKAAEERFSSGEVPCPENWGGYLLVPETIEFWQGRRSRLHDRLRFSRDTAGWRLERLAP